MKIDPLLWCLWFMVSSQITQAQTSTFNPDSAYAYTKHLSVTIGPRPMGSHNERAALNWAVQKFQTFGADTAYVLKVARAIGRGGGATNTNSGVAIGIFKGKADSTIVIGGHIDSSGREIPGANDDASGTACAIELARTWADKERHYTLVFAAFGGEERGLIGSRYFVEHYENIDDVRLMLQIDMAGADEELILFIENGDQQAPQWLIEDLYSVSHSLGYAGDLNYPVQFFSLNNTLRGAGSDHQPFIEKGIPAFDITAGINGSPIHTPLDKFEFVDKTMLKRSGVIMDALISKYQTDGIPSPNRGAYMLVPLFQQPFFVPSWLITAAAVISIFLAVGAFGYARANRLRIPKPERVRFSGSKIFFFMCIIAVFSQLGEALIQALKGLRYPWLTAFDEYMWLAALCSLLGLWVTLQLTRNWRFSRDPYVYAKRSLWPLIIIAVLLGLGSTRLALYPALSLIFLSLAILIPGKFSKLFFILLAPVSMFKLMFLEVFPFLARSMVISGGSIDTLLKSFLYSSALTLLLVVWYLPFLYGFAMLLVNVEFVHKLSKHLRRPAVGLAVFAAAIVYGGYTYSLPSYDAQWRANLRAEATYDLQSGESKLALIGNEFFRNVEVNVDTLQRQYDGQTHRDELPISFEAEWAQIGGREIRITGEFDTVNVDWQLISMKPWYTVELSVQSDTAAIEAISSDLGYQSNAQEVKFTWYSEPPETLNVQARFKVPTGAPLVRSLKATYAETPMPIQLQAKYAEISYRTIVTGTDTIRAMVE